MGSLWVVRKGFGTLDGIGAIMCGHCTLFERSCALVVTFLPL
jgi:hypothetical protein